MAGLTGRKYHRARRGGWTVPLIAGFLTACAEQGMAPPALVFAAPVFAAPEPASIALSQESASGAFLAGRAAQMHHDLDPAANQLRHALAIDPDTTELLRRTLLAVALAGQIDESAALSQRIEALDEDSIIPTLILTESRAKAGDWAGVSAVIDRLSNHGVNAYLTPLIRVWAKAGEGKYDQALEAAGALDAAGLAPMKPFHIGLVNDLAGRRGPAEQAYRAALAGQGGKSLRTVEVVAGFLHRNGQEAEAAKLIADYAAQHGETPSIKLDGKPSVTSAKEGLAEAFFDGGGALRQSGVPDLALLLVRLSLDLNPDQPLARLMAADILAGMGQWRDVEAMCRPLADDPGFAWSARMRLARNFEEMGKIDAAAKEIAALAALRPGQPDAMLALGDLWRRQKRWEDAIAAYDKAIALLPAPEASQWTVYYARGIALERANHWPRAEADFLHALEIQPDEPEVLNYLGYSWVEQGANLARATDMIEKAVKLRPTDGFIVDSLGWAFFRRGDFAHAVELLRRAVALVPGDAAINDHLGDALWHAGRLDEARFQWQHALLFDPEPELRAQLSEKLRDRQSGAANGAQAGMPAGAGDKENR